MALTRPADQINIGEVVRKTENLRLLECFGPDSTGPIEPACTLKGLLGTALQAVLDVLDQYMLSDLVDSRQELRDCWPRASGRADQTGGGLFWSTTR